MSVECGIAFGSNLGDRREHLIQAREALLAVFGTSAMDFSALYESAPVDCPDDSERFYNAVGAFHCDLGAETVLEHCQSIEAHLGRPEQREMNAPRPIDLDILYFGSLQQDLPRLTLPHPRLTQRRFVLEPLAAIRAELILPGETATVAELSKNLVSDEPPLRIVASTW